MCQSHCDANDNFNWLLKPSKPFCKPQKQSSKKYRSFLGFYLFFEVFLGFFKFEKGNSRFLGNHNPIDKLRTSKLEKNRVNTSS